VFVYRVCTLITVRKIQFGISPLGSPLVCFPACVYFKPPWLDPVLAERNSQHGRSRATASHLVDILSVQAGPNAADTDVWCERERA